MGYQMSERVTNVLKRARATREEKRRQDKEAEEKIRKLNMDSRWDEWRPLVVAALAHITDVLGGQYEPDFVEDGNIAEYRGDCWTLKVPNRKPVQRCDREIYHTPMRLEVDDIAVPVMVWKVKNYNTYFKAATLSIDAESKPAKVLIGNDSMSSSEPAYWTTEESDLLEAIADAADKASELQEMERRVKAINEERSTPEPEPETMPPPVDYWNAAIYTFENYYQMDGANLIAVSLMAIAQEVRRLTNTMENRP